MEIENYETNQETQKELGVTPEQREKEKKSSGLESAISKAKQMRNADFEKGFNFIVENLEQLGLAALEELAYPDGEFHEIILFDSIPTLEMAEEILGYREIDNQFMNIHYIVSNNFIQGLNAAAKELLERTK